MRVLSVLFWFALSASAFAQDGLEIARKATPCWNPPAAITDPDEYQAALSVRFDSSGSVAEITVVGFQPDTPLTRDLIKSFARAIRLCATRTNWRGVQVVEMPSLKELFEQPEDNLFEQQQP